LRDGANARDCRHDSAEALMTAGFAALTALFVGQTIALLVLLSRLAQGRNRLPPVQLREDRQAESHTAPDPSYRVTVIVATLNEAHRIQRCLAGLEAQGASLLEVLIVDSRSSDGTRDIVDEVSRRDPRFHLLTDPPLPSGWVGKVWALQHGLEQARGEWVLGIDADTVPRPGMIAGILEAMHTHAFDVASFAPRFIEQSPAERWLQPAMLTSLVYRTGAAGAVTTDAERVLANGQCFMARRDVLLANGGYTVARDSFSDDVTLARHLARRGARVAFLDGSEIIDVHAYASAREMWREWGRSFDLKDGTTATRRWLDVLLVWLTMAVPVPLLVPALVSTPGNGLHSYAAYPFSLVLTALIGLNALLLCLRVAMLFATRGNYADRGWSYWMSWLADIPASLRLTLSTARRPRAWRGRAYMLQNE
jgi:dolichol-phosphate mannosyltransferase